MMWCARGRSMLLGIAALLPSLVLLSLAGCVAPREVGDTGERSTADGGEPDSASVPRGAGSAAEAGLRLFQRRDEVGAEPLLVQALESAPDDPRVLGALGVIYARSDRFQEAERVLRRAIAAAPASSGSRLALTTVLADTGRYDEALVEVQDLLRRDPGHLAGRVKEALVLERLGRTEAAEAAARALTEKAPENAEAHYILGICLARRGALTEAVEEMKEVVQRVPHHLGALSRLAALEGRLGHEDEAGRYRQQHQEALRLQRVEERTRPHRQEGVAAFNREDYAEAVAAFEAVTREDPDDPQAYLFIGSAKLALGDLEGARIALERSLELGPRDARTLMELGRVHALADRLDEAVAMFRRAIEANPEFAEPHYFLAAIYMSRGEEELHRREMARYHELKALSPGGAMVLHPDAPDVEP